MNEKEWREQYIRVKEFEIEYNIRKDKLNNKEKKKIKDMIEASWITLACNNPDISESIRKHDHSYSFF